jgi:hypothetical protein
MTNRIRELAAQAKAAVPAGLVVDKWIEAYNQIFAELIVRECCDKFVDMQHQFHPSICAYEIKKHFGVE